MVYSGETEELVPFQLTQYGLRVINECARNPQIHDGVPIDVMTDNHQHEDEKQCYERSHNCISYKGKLIVQDFNV